jgi:hypothetical protein
LADGNRIFVSIASYRDPQLLPTLLDCIQKARYPERLRFGVCWQRAVDDTPPALWEDVRFRVLDVNWKASKGACWARAEVMKLWRGEEWFLQVDSHCRFAEGWDAMLLAMVAETGSAKAILSTYATPFTPGDDEVLRGGPYQMVFQGFTPEGIPQLRPGALPIQRKEKRLMRARFVAAGFLFAQGRFVEEVPYDPELYFMGEESALTVRAFTHGYDFFHPLETVVWHDYIRADAKKHWGDHVDSEIVTTPWGDLDERSKRKVQRLLLGEDVGEFGLGSVRTLAEYESYAGLSFKLRKAQQYTVRGLEVPNPPVDADWAERIYPWIARVRVQRAELPEGALGELEEPMLWSVAVLDEEGFELYRQDLMADELRPLSEAEGEIALILEFDSETVPARWTVLPLTRGGGWLRMVKGRLEDGDFAILKADEG